MPFPAGPVILVCGRVGDPHTTPLPGSIVSQCQECGHDVWMALESQRRRALDGVPVACIECYARYADAGHPVINVRQRPIYS